jgi:hypothetical protein
MNRAKILRAAKAAAYDVIKKAPRLIQAGLDAGKQTLMKDCIQAARGVLYPYLRNAFSHLKKDNITNVTGEHWPSLSRAADRIHTKGMYATSSQL